MSTNPIPTVSGTLIGGNLAQFKDDPLPLLEAARNLGPISEMRFLWVKQLVLTDPDHISHVLQTNNRNYVREQTFNEIVKLAAGESLFTSSGNEWLWRRRLMQPAFHRKRLAHFGTLIVEEAEKMRAEWDNRPTNTPFNVAVDMMQVTMQIIGRIMFSIDISKDAHELHDAFNVTSSYIIERATNPLAAPLFIPTKRNRRFKAAVATVTNIIHNLIIQRRQSGEHYGDLLDMLLEAEDEDGRKLTDPELIDEMSGIVFAGHETTANTLTWAWYLLTSHPDVWKKLQNELHTVLNGRPPTLDDLPNLTYTDQIIQETMRLYPPAWIISRQAAGADQLGDLPIPAGSKLIFNFYGLHRHPDYWEKPNSFYPDHFLPEAEAARPKFTYLPFGAGPRKCIGDNLALMEARLILATIAQHHQPELSPIIPVIPRATFILHPEKGVWLTLPAKQPQKES